MPHDLIVEVAAASPDHALDLGRDVMRRAVCGIDRLFCGLALGLGCGLLAVAGLGFDATAAETSRFNGAWHVQMVKESGLCDRDHRYAILIREGDIRYLPEPGSSPMNFTGQVDGRGSVQINASRGPARVGATGQLQGNSGSGTWRLPLLGCSGVWTAQRTSRIQTSSN
jgi:hypothetical protein